MTPDREPNRLPYRAGAMLLLAVAVVCIGLGWHSAVSTSSSPEAELAAAAESAAPSSGAPSSSAPNSSAPGSSSAGLGSVPTSAGESSASASGPLVCVYNAGSVSGLAQDVNATLKSKGWRTSAPGNTQSSSITENTVFYTPALRSDAQRLVSDLGDDASADPRPSSFTLCRGGLAVVVVTR